MHMAMVIAGGLMLLAVFVLFGWLWGHSMAGMLWGARAFIPVWLVVSLVNLWVGVHVAGYSLRAELPILLVVFAVPAVAAGLILWRLASG